MAGEILWLSLSGSGHLPIASGATGGAFITHIFGTCKYRYIVIVKIHTIFLYKKVHNCMYYMYN